MVAIGSASSGSVSPPPVSSVFWTVATRMLIAQEKGLAPAEIERQRRAAKERGQDREVIKKAFIDYLRFDFHPDDRDNYGLAERYLDSIGRLDG